MSTQNQDKMKNQLSNIAPEGPRSGDVVGGLLSWTGESLQALLFFPERGLNIGGGKRTGCPKRRLMRNSRL
jgi:hypothetical protein